MIHMSTTIELNFTKLSRNPMSPLYAQPKLCQALLFLTPIVLLNKLVGGSSKIENIITALPEVLWAFATFLSLIYLWFNRYCSQSEGSGIPFMNSKHIACKNELMQYSY